MHNALNKVYGDFCCIDLAKKGDKKGKFESVKKAFKEAANHIHSKKGFSAKMIKDLPVKSLLNQTYTALKEAVDANITYRVPDTMRQRLEKDVFIFSGMKTYMQLKEASSLLLDENRKIKPLERFIADIKAIDEKYNEQYLQAEYQFAISSAQAADRWMQFEAAGDRYDLQYRTAQDSKVRPAHQVLANITLPINDPFWDYYFTPNGWRCRCNIVQVRKGKYEISDSADAMTKGEAATTQLDKDGKNAGAIFRFNPGKQKVIFPEKHPYKHTNCANSLSINDNDKCQAKREVEKIASDKFSEKRIAEYNKLLSDKNYTDVDYDKENGGLKATHILHSFSPNNGHYEKEARDILFKAGNKIILEKELLEKGEKNIPGKKHIDGYLNDVSCDISSIIGQGKNTIKRALNHARQKGAETAILYFPNEAAYSEARYQEGINKYNGQTKYRFKKIILIVGETIK
jgi:Phage Mu protein F like protein